VLAPRELVPVPAAAADSPEVMEAARGRRVLDGGGQDQPGDLERDPGRHREDPASARQVQGMADALRKVAAGLVRRRRTRIPTS